MKCHNKYGWLAERKGCQDIFDKCASPTKIFPAGAETSSVRLYLIFIKKILIFCATPYLIGIAMFKLWYLSTIESIWVYSWNFLGDWIALLALRSKIWFLSRIKVVDLLWLQGTVMGYHDYRQLTVAIQCSRRIITIFLDWKGCHR